MIVQNASGTGTTDLSFTLHQDDFALVEKILKPLVPEIGASAMTATDGRGQAQRGRNRDAVARRGRLEDSLPVSAKRE